MLSSVSRPGAICPRVYTPCSPTSVCWYGSRLTPGICAEPQRLGARFPSCSYETIKTLGLFWILQVPACIPKCLVSVPAPRQQPIPMPINLPVAEIKSSVPWRQPDKYAIGEHRFKLHALERLGNSPPLGAVQIGGELSFTSGYD